MARVQMKIDIWHDRGHNSPEKASNKLASYLDAGHYPVENVRIAPGDELSVLFIDMKDGGKYKPRSLEMVRHNAISAIKSIGYADNISEGRHLIGASD